MSELDLLPPNATPQARALSAALARLSDVPVPLASLWDPAACPVGLLPWLAWALHVDDWDTSWSEAVKRNAVGRSLELHRRKGTPWAVEQALELAGFANPKVEEWWEYGGSPYHFRVSVGVAGGTLTPEEEARALKTIETWKNLRSRCDSFAHEVSPEGEVPAFSPGLQSSKVTTIYPL